MDAVNLLIAGVAGCGVAILVLLWRARRRCVAAGRRRWVLSPRDRVWIGFLEMGMFGLLAGAVYLREPDKPSLGFTLLVVCGLFVGGRTIVNVFKPRGRGGADGAGGEDRAEP